MRLRRAGVGALAGLVGVGLVPIAAARLTEAPKAAPAANARSDYGHVPLSFEANAGQASPGVAFVSHGGGHSLSLAATSASLSLRPGGADAASPSPGTTLGLRLVGADPAAAIAGRDQLPGKANYLVGDDPARWRTGVPTYAKAASTGVYPGIDMVWYGTGRELEYDFVVAPGADPSTIALAVSGAKALSLDDNGELVLSLPAGELRQHKPRLYQEVGGKRRAVDGGYVLRGDQFGFAVGSYDHTVPLVIDPVLAYSTFLGGRGTDTAADIAVDASGAAYVVGATDSVDFPTTPGAYQETDPTPGRAVAVVTKLNPSGSGLEYSTYLGGTTGSVERNSAAKTVAVDAAGAAYVSGSTIAADFPTTPGAYDRTCGIDGDCNGEFDAFVTKLDPTGTSLQYSTYLGGGDTDVGVSLDIDATGAAYLAGHTGSADFDTTAGVLYETPPAAGTNGFVTKMSADGSAPVWSTYAAGGSYACCSLAITAGGDGVDTYVATSTATPGLTTTPGAFQPDCHVGGTGICGDLYLTKLNAGGTGLVAATYLGGSDHDSFGSAYPHTLTVDAAGAAYVTGTTYSADFPTVNAYDAVREPHNNRFPAQDAFVTKFAADLSGLVYSTFLGGTKTANPSQSSKDGGHAIAVDPSGAAYVGGITFAYDFPTFRAWQPKWPGYFDGWVTKLTPAGNALAYSSYLGSADGVDYVAGIALSVSGAAYVTGQTYGSVFPATPGAFQPTRNLNPDGYVAKIDSTDLAVALTDSPDPVAVGTKLSYTLTLTNNGPVDATNVKNNVVLPPATLATFRSASAGCTFNSGTNQVKCGLGTIPVGTSVSVTIKVKPTPAASGQTLTATTTKLLTDQADQEPANDAATATTTVL